MVLAAGFGKRLQPLTRILPKPMFPVLGRPLLSHTFDLLRSANISEVAVNIHHLPDSIINYFEKEKPPHLNLHFSREERILGTAGGIKKMQGFLEDGSFILINSDIITDIALNQVIDFHKKNNSKLTLVVRQDHFVGASSKNIPEKTTRVMFTGIQIMEPEIFERIPAGQFCGTTEDIFPQMVQDGIPIYGYIYDGYWKDMGSRESYLQVNADALDEKVFLKGIFPNELNGPFIIPPALVGHNCHIAENSKIGPHTVIGPNCKIKNGAVVENSILWEGGTIGVGSTVKGSVVTQNRTIGDGKSINDESII